MLADGRLRIATTTSSGACSTASAPARSRRAAPFEPEGGAYAGGHHRMTERRPARAARLALAGLPDRRLQLLATASNGRSRTALVQRRRDASQDYVATVAAPRLGPAATRSSSRAAWRGGRRRVERDRSSSPRRCTAPPSSRSRAAPQGAGPLARCGRPGRRRARGARRALPTPRRRAAPRLRRAASPPRRTACRCRPR